VRLGYASVNLQNKNCRYSGGGHSSLKWMGLFKKQIRGLVVHPVYKTYSVSHWNELFRSLVTGSTGAPVGVYAVPHRSRLKRGWGSL
jgi:hypothetical protein